MGNDSVCEDCDREETCVLRYALRVPSPSYISKADNMGMGCNNYKPYDEKEEA